MELKNINAIFTTILSGIIVSIIGPTLKRIFLNWWKRRPDILFHPKRPHCNNTVLNYLRSFIHIDRFPSWDTDIFESSRIAKNRVILREGRVDEPAIDPESLESQYSCAGSIKKWKVEELAQTIGVKSSHRSKEKNVNVFLGAPGTGKSTLVLQIAEYLAKGGSHNNKFLVPVYINLAGFDARWQITKEGFQNFLSASINASCPRYLPRSTITEASQKFSKYIMSPENALPLLIILDSMDEMPTSGYTDRIKIITSFINNHLYLEFIVTCRPRDFVTIKDYSANFQIQRFDLLPWDQSVKKGNIGKEKLKGINLAISGRTDALSATLCAISGSTSGGLDDIWNAFINKQFNRVTHDNLEIENAKNNLAQLAYEMCILDKHDPILNGKSEVISKHAGLIHKLDESGYKFAIRPLANYFVALHLSNIFQQEKKVAVEKIDDVNIREIMVLFSAIRRDDFAWWGIILNLLKQNGTLRDHGERLLFATECLQVKQLSEATQLLDTMFSTLELLILKGDGVSHQQALQAVSLRSEIFTLDPERIRTLFALIIENGPDTSRVWIFKTILENRKVWCSCWEMLIPLVSKLLDERKFGTSLRVFITSFFEDKNVFISYFIDLSLRGAFFASFMVFLYCLYIIGLWTTKLIFTQIPMTFGLNVPWNFSIIILPSTLWEWSMRILLLGFCLFIPVYGIQKQAKIGGEFCQIYKRVISYLLICIALRSLFFMPFLTIESFSQLSSLLELGAVVFFTIVFAFTFLGILFILKKTFRPKPKEPLEFPFPVKVNPRIILWYSPTRLIQVLLGAVFQGKETLTHADGKRLKWIILFISASILFIIVMSIYDYFWFSFIILSIIIILIVIGRLILFPLLEVSKLHRKILESGRNSLRTCFEESFKIILDKIIDTKVPVILKLLYIHLLKEVHYNTQDMLENLENCYKKLRSGVVYNEMTRIIIQARKEIYKNAKWN